MEEEAGKGEEVATDGRWTDRLAREGVDRLFLGALMNNSSFLTTRILVFKTFSAREQLLEISIPNMRSSIYSILTCNTLILAFRTMNSLSSTTCTSFSVEPFEFLPSNSIPSV